MAISVFPAPSAASGGNAFAADLTAKNTTYEQINNFEPGVYTVTCSPSTSNVTAVFVNATSVLSTVVTSSGTVGLSLASAATKVYLTLTNASTVPTIVTITKTASALNPDDIGNGTLDTINATGTYNQTGLLSVLVIGGGQFGFMSGTGGSKAGGSGPYLGGGGGRAGFINGGIVYTNTATTVTVGAKGVARNTTGGSDVSANNSSFGNLITANAASNVWTNVNGGAGGGIDSAGDPGPTSQTFASWNTNSTLGGGGGGNGLTSAGRSTVRVGGGSGIGTGGSGGGSNSNDNSVNAGIANIASTDATGKGSGGGGGAGTGYSQTNAVGRFGGDGSDGVVYVLRGF